MSYYESKFTKKEVQIFKIGEAIKDNVAVKVESYSYEDDDPAILDKLTALVQSGQSDSIDTLILGEWKEPYETEPPFLDFLIEHRNKFSIVKHLFFGDMDSEQCEMSWITQGNYEKLLAAYTDIESLYVQGSMDLSFGRFSLPNLSTFHLYTGGLPKNVLQEIIKSNTFQNLEDLEIWFGEEEYGASHDIEDVRAFLNLEMPKVKRLGLMNSELQNDIVKLLATHPILSQIEHLDISMGILQDEGGKVLLDGAFDHLKSITCEHHFMSEDMMSKLQAKFGDQLSLSEPEDDDGGEWYYVAVGE